MMRSIQGGRNRLVLAVVMAVAFAGCASGPAPLQPTTIAPPSRAPTSGETPSSPRPSATAPSIEEPPSAPGDTTVACRPADLVFRAGRDGETGIVHIGAQIANLSATTCSVPAVPAAIELVRQNGTVLRLAVEPPIGDRTLRVLVPVGAVEGADLIAYWTNWCGRSPEPLDLQITFDTGDTAVRAPLEGELLPRCDNPGAASTIQIDSVAAAGP